MRSRSLMVLAAAAAALVALSGCRGGTAAQQPLSKNVSGSITAWAFDSADDVGTARLDYANARLRRAGAGIELDRTAFDAQKFATRTASGRVPDVVQMSSQFVTTYAARGLIIPLDRCYSLYGVDPSGYFYPQVAADVTYDRKVWGVPQFYQPPAILVDERVARTAGVTHEDLNVADPDRLLAAIEKMTVMDGATPTRVGFDPQGVAKAGLWMRSFGGRLVDGAGRPTLDDAENAEAIDYLKRIYDAQGGYAEVKSLVDSFDVFGDGNQFVKDQVGAEVFDQWYVNVLSGYSDRVELGATPFRNQDAEPFTVASGQAFVIPSRAKNPSAACRWMIDVTSPAAWDDAGKAREATLEKTPDAINTGLFTGVKSVDEVLREKYVPESGETGFTQTIDTYYEILPTGESFGSSPAGQQIQSELQSAVSSALTGESTAEEALARAQRAAMAAYDRATR